MAQVFDFIDYREYLQSTLSAPKAGKHGAQSELARHLGCQASHISKVLNGSAQFSLEQADLANSFFGHTEDQSDYFILLVEFDRAGTQRLKRHFERHIQRAREYYLNMKKRFKVKDSLSAEDQATFYSAWYYSAIHAALSVPELQTADALATRFKLPLQQVSSVLEFLLSTGMTVQQKGKFLQTSNRTHLSRTSPLIAKHHLNWRLQAAQALDRSPDTDLHFSAVTTLSKEDVFRIKAELVKAIESANQIIGPSKEEVVFGFCIDFFEL